MVFIYACCRFPNAHLHRTPHQRFLIIYRIEEPYGTGSRPNRQSVQCQIVRFVTYQSTRALSSFCGTSRPLLYHPNRNRYINHSLLIPLLEKSGDISSNNHQGARVHLYLFAFQAETTSLTFIFLVAHFQEGSRRGAPEKEVHSIHQSNSHTDNNIIIITEVSAAGITTTSISSSTSPTSKQVGPHEATWRTDRRRA